MKFRQVRAIEAAIPPIITRSCLSISKCLIFRATARGGMATTGGDQTLLSTLPFAAAVDATRRMSLPCVLLIRLRSKRAASTPRLARAHILLANFS
jgi:hypothetical protein